MPGQEQGAPKPAPEDKPQEHDDGKTAVLPVDIFPGGPPKPGDRCEFEAVAVHGEEVQVRYVEHDEKEEGPEGGEPPAEPESGPPGPPDEMAGRY